MKKVICILLSIAVCTAVFSACGSETKSEKKAKQGYKILYRDDFNSKKITAKLVDGSGKKVEAEIEKVSKDDDSTLYAVYGDTEKYSKVIFVSDFGESGELAFNELVSGWHETLLGIYPFADGMKESEEVSYDTKTMKFDGEEKEIYICTPDGYDKNAKEKYPVIYMTDGQNLFDRESTSYGSWGVYESVRSMQKTVGKTAVIVGISNPSMTRDSELTPDIGDVTTDPETYENGKGKEFSDFVADKVVPYVEKNYNVSSEPEDVAICGSSSGGIECFFIGMEHSEKFGTIGALSPAFGLFDDNTWVKYLKTRKFKDNYPKVYIYCGEGADLESDLVVGAKSMPANLAKIDYPEDKITENYYAEGLHNETYWRFIFPDFLKTFIN